MRLTYHPDAEAELIQAARFYESRVSTLGSEFLDAGDRFPYAVYYRVFPDHIRILAFKHHSRHPDYWRYRLPD